MFVNSISIRREGYFGSNYGKRADPTKPFNATIEVRWFSGGSCGSWSMQLSTGNAC